MKKPNKVTLQHKHNLSQTIWYQVHAYIKQNLTFVDEVSNVECRVLAY